MYGKYFKDLLDEENTLFGEFKTIENNCNLKDSQVP